MDFKMLIEERIYDNRKCLMLYLVSNNWIIDARAEVQSKEGREMQVE